VTINSFGGDLFNFNGTNQLIIDKVGTGFQLIADDSDNWVAVPTIINSDKPIPSTTDDLPEGADSLYNQSADKATLDALPRKEGKIYYALDEETIYFDNGTDLVLQRNDLGLTGTRKVELENENWTYIQTNTFGASAPLPSQFTAIGYDSVALTNFDALGNLNFISDPSNLSPDSVVTILNGYTPPTFPFDSSSIYWDTEGLEEAGNKINISFKVKAPTAGTTLNVKIRIYDTLGNFEERILTPYVTGVVQASYNEDFSILTGDFTGLVYNSVPPQYAPRAIVAKTEIIVTDPTPQVGGIAIDVQNIRIIQSNVAWTVGLELADNGKRITINHNGKRKAVRFKIGTRYWQDVEPPVDWRFKIIKDHDVFAFQKDDREFYIEVDKDDTTIDSHAKIIRINGTGFDYNFHKQIGNNTVFGRALEIGGEIVRLQGAFENTSQKDLPNRMFTETGDKADLVLAERIEGKFYYANDEGRGYIDIGTKLIPIGDSPTPTASIFDNTQFGTVPFPVTTEVLSVSTWVKLDSTDLTHQIFMTDGDNYSNVFQLYYDNVGSTGYKCWHKYAGVEINVPLAIDNNYHHFVCVYDGQAGSPYIELFMDGVSVGSAVVTAPQALAISETFSLGTDDTGFPIAGQTTYRLKGKVANMELWAGLLNAADALALYNAGYYQEPKTLVDKPLLAQWLFGDSPLDTTAIVKDNVGSADITYVGSVVFDQIDLPPKQVAVDNATLESVAGVLRVKAGGIQAPQIAADEINSSHLQNESVTTAKIADLNVTNVKIGSNAVSESKLRLSNATFARARNFADSADINLIGANASDKIVFGSLPQDATVPTDNADLSNKKYVDDAAPIWASGVTGSRPTGVIGLRYFDTTLGKPIWFDGTNWVDATGAIV
jgi:hypothetical protein